VLLPWADELPAAGCELVARLDDATLTRALDLVPDDWFVATPELARLYDALVTAPS